MEWDRRCFGGGGAWLLVVVEEGDVQDAWDSAAM